MVFLPGSHTLNVNINVANVSRLTMCREPTPGNRATIVCKESVGLSFTSVMEFKIYSLAFTSCSRLLKYNTIPSVYVALHLQFTQRSELVNCSFHDNNGTALVVNNTNITLTGNTEFKHNRACGNIIGMTGGSIIALSSNLTFIGNTIFLHNTGVPEQYRFPFRIFVVSGGAIFASQNTVLTFSGTSNFINNSAYSGGAIYTEYSVVRFNGTNHFINNSAYDGNGGAIATNSTVLTLNGTSQFIKNSATGAGGAIYTIGSSTVLTLNGTSQFINNSAIYAGGAIYTIGSNKVTFNGIINIANNYGVNEYNLGGGMYVGPKSTFSILPHTNVYWEKNHAQLGGAIYVDDTSPLSYCTSVAPHEAKQECFFQLPGQNLSNGIDVKLVFKNNFAYAGSVLYGGAIDNCKLNYGLDSYSSGKVFDMMVHNNDTDYHGTSNISSVPLRICPCENNLPDCRDVLSFPRPVYLGETFQVSVAAVGQRNGTVAGRVNSMINQIYNPAHLSDSQHLQQTNNTCTTLNYTVLSASSFFRIWTYLGIDLYAEGSPSCSVLVDTNTLEIRVDINPTCPPGFNISDTEESCVCEPRLAHYTNSCTITNGVGQITREAGQQFWVGYDDQSQFDDKLVFHPRCPYDYCFNREVTFSLNESYKQCALNRSHLLCGACKEGYSLLLGTSQCWNCTNNYYLALLIPFAVMGVALVFSLFVCKLTVATGMLSGLVFYANIVGVNRAIFLPVEYTNALSVFIAWLNLDFGIETCFYVGMDAYSKTWLQFVFPVYIWVLVGLMILVSHFSQRFANMLGNNPVSVLATLLLLSYTKILRTLIAAINITYLEYPTYNRMVWLYDANIGYLSSKHIPLFIVAVLFFPLPLSSLHSLASLWSVAASHITLEALLMGQKCPAETFHGFIPCSLQSKTSLLAWTAACTPVCSFSSVCFESSGRPQC